MVALKNNIDLTMTYAATIVGAVLLYTVGTACSGPGCIFGLVLVVVSMMVAVASSAVVIIRRLRQDRLSTVWVAVPALVIIATCAIVIAANVRPL